MSDPPRDPTEYTGRMDDNMGVSVARGIPFAYEQGDSDPNAEVYRVTTRIEPLGRPVRNHVYYVPAERLDRFFDRWGQTGEQLVDVRPTTWDEASREMAGYRGDE